MDEKERQNDLNETSPKVAKDPMENTLVLGETAELQKEIMKKNPQPKNKKANLQKKSPPKGGNPKNMKQVKKQKQKQRRFFSPVFTVLLVCFIVVFSWAGYVGAYVVPLIWGNLGNASTSLVAPETQKATFEKGQFTVLMMGADARPGEDASRSDTLMVAYVDLNSKVVRLVSIPRDTYVELPTGWETKINHAYSQGGIDETIETLEDNFDIKIDYTAEVDFQGFRDVIDALGGVTIDVPMDMEYAAEGIDLKKGMQTLDGDQALQFCRFRGDGQGDIGRVDRQQLFMTTLKDQLISMGTMLKIPDVCTAIKDNIVTNLTGAQLLQIIMELDSGFDLITLEPPGEGRYAEDGISYYFLYKDQSKDFFEAVNNYEPTAQELEKKEGKNAEGKNTEESSEDSESTTTD